MTNESNTRWTKVDALFAEVIALDPDSRRSYVSRISGGDAILEQEVLALIESLERAEVAIGESADSLLDISGPLVDAPEPPLPNDTRLGAYRIVRELGRGGMGAVYLAQRVEGDFERDVAIKVMRRAHDSKALLRRFAVERRILGALEHPHIARLYDSGISPDGRPYLVMQYVEGERIDRWTDQGALGIKERLALFDAVCSAVVFAHQRLVVHRDLKPANVLVSAEGHVTLLDFGIAKLLDSQSGPADDPATRPGQLVLTPEYASPEQARGESPSVAMDIYALGVLLHELLTGARPAWQRLVVSGADASAVESAMIAPSRTTKNTQVARVLRGDLDTVVLTALTPSAEQRYSSVQALRDDVQRVRSGYPISARRATWSSRASKFIRRNRLLTAAAALLVVVTAAFTYNAQVQARLLTAERDSANAARLRAERTSVVLRDILGSADPFRAEGSDTLRASQLLARSAVRIDEDLREEPVVRAALLLEIGRTLRSLGELGAAQRALDTALALRERSAQTSAAERAEVLAARAHLARDLERFAEAGSLYQRSLREREQANADSTPARASLAASLASVGSGFLDQNRMDSARWYMDSALIVMRSLPVADSAQLASLLNVRATLAMRSGDFPTALSLMREGYSINLARRGADDPNTVRDLGNVGFLLDRLGQSEAAVPLLRDALARNRSRLPENHPAIRSVMLNLGGALGRLGSHAEAEQLLRDVVAADRARGDEGARALTMSMDNLGVMLESQQQPAEAQAIYHEASAIGRRVFGDQDPGAAVLLSKSARLRCATDNDASLALREFTQALAVLERAYPAGHGFRLGATGGYGTCLVRAGRREQGEALLHSAFDSARRGSAATHGMARTFGRELLKLYTAPGDSTQRATVQSQIDSIAATLRPKS